MSSVDSPWRKYFGIWFPLVICAVVMTAVLLVWSTPWPATILIAGRVPLGRVQFSPDGSVLATRDVSGAFKVWDAAMGKILEFRSKEAAPDWFSSKGFLSPDRRISVKYLFSSGWPQTNLALVDVATGKTLYTIVGHRDQLNSFAFSPDGQLLATGGGYTAHPWPVNRAGDARIWDVKTGKLLSVLGWHWGAVSSVDFSPDGKTLATACYDGVVRLWRIR